MPSQQTTLVGVPTKRMAQAVYALIAERGAQDKKWGPEQDNPHEVWHLIISEELGEVAEAILDLRAKSGGWGSARCWDHIRFEAVQVMASACAYIEWIDAHRPKGES